jgi:uncharacterized membrane protein YoaK (UPF0700 family)
MLWVLFLVFWIFACWSAEVAFCGKVASAKGYSELKWTILGAIFPVIALIAIAGLPNISAKRAPDEGK